MVAVKIWVDSMGIKVKYSGMWGTAVDSGGRVHVIILDSTRIVQLVWLVNFWAVHFFLI